MEDYCGTRAGLTVNVGTGLNSSLLITKSRFGHKLQAQKCTMKILSPGGVDGLIVSVHNISIVNRGPSCVDYVEFNHSPALRWCDTSKVSPLVFPKASMVEMTFMAGMNSQSDFELIVTPFMSKINYSKIILLL